MTSADEDFGSRRQRGDGRRGPAHAKTSPRWPAGKLGDFVPTRASQTDALRVGGDSWIARQDPHRPDAGQPPPADYYPSQPGHFGQYSLHPDHPSWPQSQVPPWLRAEAPTIDDDPRYHGGGRPAAGWEPPPPAHYPTWEPPAPAHYHGQHQPSAVAVAPTLPARGRPGFAPRPDLAPRGDIPIHGDIALHPGPLPQERAARVVDWVQPDVDQVPPGRGQIWDAGSSQLATWILADANQEAAEIARQARDQAATSLADAQQEAAELVRRTSEQAKLTLEAAELQAAEIRATVMKLSAELTGMAAYVTENLTSAAPAPTPPATKRPAQPTIRPVPEPTAWPGAGPAAKPAATPRARPNPQPGAKPARPPGTEPSAAQKAQPAGRPNAKPRQYMAIRAMSVFTATLVLFALTAGATEVALHGFRFFVFRSAGTGETSSHGLQEDQGPGQPDAPGARR
jgi:hypothetical protein